MNKLAYVFLSALTIACANSSPQATEKVLADEPVADTAIGIDLAFVEGLDDAGSGTDDIDTAISIDSEIVAEAVLEDICLFIHRSTYPKISGLVDQRFEKQLNEILRRNFNTYISLIKKEFGGCPEEEEEEEEDYSGAFPSASGEFSVLTKNDSMVSIVQYMISTVGYGGNSWTPSSYALTADVKNNILYGRKEFRMDRAKIGDLNAKIKYFFDEQFPDEAKSRNINYPIIKTNRDFDALNFAIRNDSLVLIREAYPSGHFSYGTYIVPIEKMPILKAGSIGSR